MADDERVLPDAAARSPKKGRLSRAIQLSKLAVGAGGRMIAEKARGFGRDAAVDQRPSDHQYVAIAEEMLSTLSEMKGLAMKVGQMLSYVESLMPPEAQRVLAALQRDAKPVTFDEIRQVFVEDHGVGPEERFAEFEPTPAAAASIGQVHRARTHEGLSVAVKIQYPGIAEAMAADLKNARMFSIFQRLFFFRTNTTAIMAELEERLLDECDYRKEAEYQDLFRARFEGHPVIEIPEVHHELSSRRVLTTTWYDGMTFHEWLARGPDPDERHQAMATFYRFYLGSLYLDGLFNCDPHPGNYLFLDSGRIVFLDHGCARFFPEERRKLWIGICQAVAEDDGDRIQELARAIGFIPEGVDEYDHEAFTELMRYLYRAYLEDRPYDFRDHPPQQTFREMFLENPNLLRMDMPPDAVFLNRITFGLVSLLTEIGAKINVHQIANAYFEGHDLDWPDDPRAVVR